MSSISFKWQYCTLRTKIWFDSIHAQNHIKSVTKKVQREQVDMLDEIWDKNKDFRFDIEQDLVKKLGTDTKGLVPMAKEYKVIKRSNKLVTFVLWYYTTENSKKLDGTKRSEREFINAVAYELGQPKIYSDEGLADLKFYDPDSDSYMENPEFITSIKKILERATINFEEKVEAATVEESEEIKDDVNDNKVIGYSPIKFGASPSNTFIPGKENEPVIGSFENAVENNQSNLFNGNIPENVKKVLNKQIEPHFKNVPISHNYRINDYGVLELLVNYYGATVPVIYPIDTGSFYGSDNYALIYSAPLRDGSYRLYPVPFSEKDMLANILTNVVIPENKPTAEEVIEMRKKYELNPEDFRARLMFDLSGLKLKSMKQEDRFKLDETLTKLSIIIFTNAKLSGMLDIDESKFAINAQTLTPEDELKLKADRMNQIMLQTPRFRITSFDNPESFSFNADPVNTKRYFAEFPILRAHNGNCNTGWSGVVKGNTFTFYDGVNPSILYNLNDVEL